MKYQTNIDNLFVFKHKLTLQEGALLDWFIQLHTWADQIIKNNEVYYFASKKYAVKELPNITEKPDTMYRYYKKLETKGFVKIIKSEGKDYIHVTKKCAEWGRQIKEQDTEENEPVNQTSDYSENYPSSEVTENQEGYVAQIDEVGKLSDNSDNYPNQLGKLSESTRKKIRHISNTNNTNTNNHFYKNESEFLEDFSKIRLEFDKQPTNIKKLARDEKMNFESLKNEFSKNEFVDALKGMFMQKKFYALNKLRPRHFLEKRNIEIYLDAFINDIQIFNGKESNKNGNPTVNRQSASTIKQNAQGW